MKKLLLLLALCLIFFLVGCNYNNNSKNINYEGQNNNQIINSNNLPIEKEEPHILEYDSADFSDKAGFKVTLDSSLKNVTYDSIFLMNKTTAQLDLIFSDKSSGTLIIDTTNSSYLYNTNDTILIDSTRVSIEHGEDGIFTYEWSKDNYTYIYSTNKDIKNSELLANIVNGIKIEKSN